MTSWVLIDDSQGAKAGDGSSLTPAVLAHIVEACSAQSCGEVAREHGGASTWRLGARATDVEPGESVYAFVGTLPDEPGASAYHDKNGVGVPFAFCAVTTCGSMLGPDGVSVDGSHEGIEAQVDPGCNRLLDDGVGTLHADEACDACETNSYPYTCADGTVVYLSDFLLQAWMTPGAPGPYTYMQAKGMAGAFPAAPMATAVNAGGNYQITCPSTTAQETSVFARETQPDLGEHTHGPRIVGARRKGKPHWSSRAYRRGAR